MKKKLLTTALACSILVPSLLFNSPSLSAEEAPQGAPSFSRTSTYCVPSAWTNLPTKSQVKAERGRHLDNYHGTQVADPYRWMENIDSQPTQQWIAEQRLQTERYLSRLPQRQALRQRLEELYNYERTSIPVFRKTPSGAGLWFYSYNTGLQNQSVLYVCTEPTPVRSSPNERVLLDPNVLSPDGTSALAGAKVSPDGQWLAYGIAEAGSDWNVWQVRNVATGQDLPDRLDWVKFSTAAWRADGAGFFYCRYPAPDSTDTLKAVNENHTVYYHQLNTPQSQDQKIYGFADHPKWAVGCDVSHDGRWLIISGEPHDTPNTTLVVRDLSKAGAFVTLPNAGEAQTTPIAVIGNILYAMTNLQAPRFRVVSCDLTQPAESLSWCEVIPQQEDALQSVDEADSRLVASYLHHACAKLQVYDLQGQLLKDIPLPGKGTVASVSTSHDSPEVYYSYTSFNTPSCDYSYTLGADRSQPWRHPRLQYDPNLYETSQVFFTSKDGTKVPMFISHKRGIAPNGKLPTLMYGYGGFSISITPSFSPLALSWMEQGGVYAVVNLRGGSEYGEEWHQAGTKTHKQNVFDDFIAAGEWLIAQNYTKPERLAIMGGSNGGLLVGACMTQRPAMFAACIPQVGVMDMLRFAEFTIGYHWISDYGDVHNPDEFRALYAYSPYHNLKQADYPATLVTTGDHDDRVFPAHSFKFTQALQDAQQGQAPILIRINSRAGHGAGKPTSMRLDEWADIQAFLDEVMGLNSQQLHNVPQDKEK